MGCLLKVRYDMYADILRQTGYEPGAGADGYWDTRQDPDSGAFTRVWVQVDVDPTTTGTQLETIECAVRGVIDGGIRVAGTTERWADTYENVDWAKINFPSNVLISKRDRITNVRLKKTGQIIWTEEEMAGNPPTIFEVVGVTPVVAPVLGHAENVALLQRAEVQTKVA